MLDNALFANYIARLLAKAPRGVSDLRDVEAVRNDPDARTPQGWFTTWMERAESARALARETLLWGDAPSAASAYLRACEYYRAAASVYWPERGDAAVADAMRLHVECFRAALDLDGPPYRPLAVPIGQGGVAGYLLRPRTGPAGDSRLAVALMCCGPSDGTAEEQYGLLGAEALQHGWRVILADPGDLERACGTCDGPRQVLVAIRGWLAETAHGLPSRLAMAGLGDGAGLAQKLASVDGEAKVIWPPASARHALRPVRPNAVSDVEVLAGTLSSLRVPGAVLARGADARAPIVTGASACDELDRMSHEA